MRNIIQTMLAACIATAAGCAGHAATEKPVTTTPAPVTRPDTVYARPSIDQAIAEGVEYLKSSQNKDGSWGNGTQSHGNDIDVSVPGSHQAFRVATTALCVMALREAGETTAHDRGVEYLLAHGDVRRADPELIYNIWAHLYVVQALSTEPSAESDPRIRQMIQLHLGRMARYETYTGGWNYYDFDAGAERPAGGATSFGTAAGLVGLFDAKQAGFAVDKQMVGRGVLRLEQMRLPNGAYIYDSDLKYHPDMPANQVRGSVGRIQPGNLALYLWNSKKMTPRICRQGLDTFFREHDGLEMGRKRPYPHESWYQTSGYYFYFDHYYAARLIEALGGDARSQYCDRLAKVILSHQEPDGSWWDYPMWGYHKPYGTAFAVMTLLRCK